MKIRYVGIHDEVVVDMPLGGEQYVRRGFDLTTTDAHGAALLEQERNWALPTKTEAPSESPEPNDKKKSEVKA